MYAFPLPHPPDGEIHIDFTHRIEKPDSENYIRWQNRLTTIEKEFGAKGDDSLWAAVRRHSRILHRQQSR